MQNIPNQAPEHLLPLCGSGRGTLPSPFGANRACGKSLEKSRQQVTNNLLVKSVGIKFLFQVSWHFLLLARLFIIRELILKFVSLTIRFDCGLHFAFIYLFRSSVCGICNLTINEKNGLKCTWIRYLTHRWIEKILNPHLCIVCFITFLAIYQGKFGFGKF